MQPPPAFGIDQILYLLRHRYLYLKRRVTSQQAAYFKHEHVAHFWNWFDAALELRSLTEYAGRYKAVKSMAADTSEGRL